MTPGTLLRTAALQALATAAALDPADPDFAPLIGAQVQLGQTWRTQSSTPGAAAMPNQILVYGWDQKSETTSLNTTAPQFETTFTLVLEARVEVKAPAAQAALPEQPSQAAIDAAIDGALDALCYAVKKAICQGLLPAATSLNGNTPLFSGIKSAEIAQKLEGEGQRILGNGAVMVELVAVETFEPLIPNALSMVTILIGGAAGGVAGEANHGNGEISSVTVGLGAVPGAYAVSFTSSTAFSVTSPSGAPLGSGTVGEPFSGGIGFTITAGTVAFAPGDGFTVTVQAASQTILDPSA